jgi:hypothetical protein
MQEIAVHEISDGQVLAEDVACPETGQVLLAAGIELRGSHVELLERRGVLTVRILRTDGPDEGGAGETGAERSAGDSFADAIERLAHMFEGLDDDPIMRAIHAAARGMVETAMRGGGQG